MPYGNKTAYKKRSCYKMKGPSLYKKMGCEMCGYGKEKCTCKTTRRKKLNLVDVSTDEKKWALKMKEREQRRLKSRLKSK